MFSNLIPANPWYFCKDKMNHRLMELLDYFETEKNTCIFTEIDVRYKSEEWK